MRNDPRGSLWRQWDFHFHTPASYDHDNKGLSDQEIVSHLVDAGISAVVVTDHHRMDVARIKSLQAHGEGKLIVFPGIELRCELGGKTSVHYIGIFPEDCDTEQLWTNLQGPLRLHPNDVAVNGGDDGFYVPFREGAQRIKELGGLISIHAGKKSNSIEEICGAEEFKRQVKADMLLDYVDFLEVGKVADVDAYRRIVFPAIGKRLPIIIGSDNHNSAKYIRKAPCWLKADLTFAGLRHILHEPEERVCFDDVPAVVKRVSDNRTKYIDTIKIGKIDDAKCHETWFNSDLPLNPGLVAIIGNKGSGKSALADIIALLGDSLNGNHFSFLHRDRFRQPKNNKSQHFTATIKWHSGGSAIRSLNEEVAAGTIESVRYLPQSYLETICDTLADANAGAFESELKAVIFSHVSATERLGFNSLDQILEHKTSEAHRAIQLLRNELEAAVKKVVEIELLGTTAYRTAISQKIAAKQRELEAHLSQPIAAVPKPANTPEVQQQIAEAEARIEALVSEQQDIAKQSDELTARSGEYSRRIVAADLLLARLKTFQLQFEKLQRDSTEDCKQLDLNVEDIASLTIKTDSILAKKIEASTEKDHVDAQLDEATPGGIKARQLEVIRILADLRKTLDLPNQLYQQYLLDQAKWNERRLAIEGNDDIPDTLIYFQRQLAELDSLPDRIAAAYDECVAVSIKIHEHISSIADVYRTFYKPVQQFIERHPLAERHFQLSFEAALAESGFCGGLLEYINHSKRGSFCGVSEGRERAHQLSKSGDFNSKDGLKSFIESVVRSLRFDTRESTAPLVQIQDQLAKGKELRHLLNFIFGLTYLKPSYSLRWAGKEIKELSPGERGTLLLVFYLLIDLADIPLIIDQPEENLDNQTVFDILVPSIKEAKTKRQIIMVTHNPNLAVVCDADQVIYATMSKQDGNAIRYDCGSIENLQVNRKLVDILEGTWPAFDNRGRKYMRDEL